MPRKSRIITSVATVLAALAVLALAMRNGHGGLAYAGESGRPANNEMDRAQDGGSLVPTGRLVRVSDAGAAACGRAPAPVLDAIAIDTAMKGQVAHLARMSAEVRGLDDVVLPEELQKYQSDAQLAAALHDERAAFAERKGALASQIATLGQAKELEQREIEFTEAKEAALARQAALLQNELDNINGLMNKGLAVTMQKIALEQNAMETESNRLDVKLLILRAQQEVKKIERNIDDLRNQWHSEALAEFSKTQQMLTTLSQQARSLAARGANAAPPAPASESCNETKELLYVIVAGPGGLLQAFPVADKAAARGEAPTVVARGPQ